MCKINYFNFLHISFIWKLYFSNCFANKLWYTLKCFIFICWWYLNLIMNNKELVKSWYYINLCFNFLNACKWLLAKKLLGYMTSETLKNLSDTNFYWMFQIVQMFIFLYVIFRSILFKTFIDWVNIILYL